MSLAVALAMIDSPSPARSVSSTGLGPASDLDVHALSSRTLRPSLRRSRGG